MWNTTGYKKISLQTCGHEYDSGILQPQKWNYEVKEISVSIWFSGHRPLIRYIKLWGAHVPGMPRKFFPSPWVSDPDTHRCKDHLLVLSFDVPGIPGACATRNFACLAKDPLFLMYIHTHLVSKLTQRYAGNTFPAPRSVHYILCQHYRPKTKRQFYCFMVTQNWHEISLTCSERKCKGPLSSPSCQNGLANAPLFLHQTAIAISQQPSWHLSLVALLICKIIWIRLGIFEQENVGNPSIIYLNNSKCCHGTNLLIYLNHWHSWYI